MGASLKCLLFSRKGPLQDFIDVQCFDLKSCGVLKTNPNHQEISASFYANPESKGAVNMLM